MSLKLSSVILGDDITITNNEITNGSSSVSMTDLIQVSDVISSRPYLSAVVDNNGTTGLFKVSDTVQIAGDGAVSMTLGADGSINMSDGHAVSFNVLPTCAGVPDSANQIANKAFVDGIGSRLMDSYLTKELLIRANADNYADVSLTNDHGIFIVAGAEEIAHTAAGDVTLTGGTGVILNTSARVFIGDANASIEFNYGGDELNILSLTRDINMGIASGGTGTFNFVSIPILDATPTLSTHVVNKAYVDSVVSGTSHAYLQYKLTNGSFFTLPSGSFTKLTLQDSSPMTLVGSTLEAGMRYLFKVEFSLVCLTDEPTSACYIRLNNGVDTFEPDVIGSSTSPSPHVAILGTNLTSARSVFSIATVMSYDVGSGDVELEIMLGTDNTWTSNYQVICQLTELSKAVISSP